MSSFQSGIDALLQDINSNREDPEHGQPPLPYSRPNATMASFNRNHPTSSSQLPARGFQEQYASPDLYPRQTASNFRAQEDTNLDDFDRDLLAEPATPPLWQSSNRLQHAPTRRLTLPGHTAPCLSATSYQSPNTQARRNVVPSPQDFRSQLVQYVHTPPRQMDVGSPTAAPPSSPSFRVRQRKLGRVPESITAPIVPAPSTPCLPAHHQAGMKRKKAIQHDGRDEQPRGSRYSVQQQIELSHAPPMVQGIQLLSLNQLPDRLRSVFQHPLFNAIQSKCFPTAYMANDNLVVSAPTGSGKTAILEMAICRLVSGYATGQYKIVYMAPTKSLCSERQRDWQSRFAALDLQCAELTGDTEFVQLPSVRNASIIITTPEKWDSMTRKWKDHARLVQMVKLLLIDEVHILKDTRGATLEAVVSRMKSIGTSVRFVALSATVPNSEDIATWLGKDSNNRHLPAVREIFGEDFRPVRLQKHVIGVPHKGNSNDFGFEAACDPRLPDIIARYSHKKPIMVFCISRKSTISTAKLLAKLWDSKNPRDRYWEGPTQKIVVQDPDLRQTFTSGVAFHHAGLDGSDRQAIEKGFLEGQVNVICCTSTLAVGVNLPCHMVIIKTTVSWTDNGIKEYSDLEIMQMLGRAGRPQFDTSAIAVIITRQEKVTKYERLVSGAELLESCLHLNLINHLNAEIGLGTIYDLHTAKRWLAGTFLFVRLGQKPDHYKLDGDATHLDLDDRIQRVCERDLALLKDSNLIASFDGKLRATELGDAMARYYVDFQTMQILLQLEPRAKVSDILSAVVQAKEFQDIRLKSYEKKLYKTINGANGIRFPIKVDLAMHAHKRSLILQSELGCVEFPADEQYVKHKRQFNMEKTILFSHVNRLLNCVTDCQIILQDAVAARHALELSRSVSARIWENSPYQMAQIDQIGLVAIRKLALGGINSIEALEAAEPHRIEMLLSRNPPLGQKILDKLKDFPKLRVSVKLMETQTPKGRPAIVKIKAECGFMNDKVPINFRKRPLFVCVLTERSDGHLVDFKRISAKHLNNGRDFLISAEVLNHAQYLTCYVMCDAVAGTLRHAELKLGLPAYLFPVKQQQRLEQASTDAFAKTVQCEQKNESLQTSPATLGDDEFGGSELEDKDMVHAIEDMDFQHIESVAARSRRQQTKSDLSSGETAATGGTAWNPEKLENGKWACNHKCKDKSACKHMCCREGVDKAPKPPKGAFVSAASLVDASTIAGRKRTNEPGHPTDKAVLSQIASKRQSARIETVNLAGAPTPAKNKQPSTIDLRSLRRLHDSVVKGPATPIVAGKRPLSKSTNDNQYRPQTPGGGLPLAEPSDAPSTDYGSDCIAALPSPSALLSENSVKNVPETPYLTTQGMTEGDDLPAPLDLLRHKTKVTNQGCDQGSSKDIDFPDHYPEEESDIEAAMIGLSDSIHLGGDAPPIRDHGTMSGVGRLPMKDTKNTEPTDFPSIGDWGPSSKLFISSDSPEKAETLPQKRMQWSGFEPEDASLEPEAKRQRYPNQADPALQTSRNADNQVVRADATIKPGQPDWVYDFDPAFIAEWQDIVEFI